MHHHPDGLCIHSGWNELRTVNCTKNRDGQSFGSLTRDIGISSNATASIQAVGSTCNHKGEIMMRSLRIVGIIGTFISLLGGGMPSYAQEAKGPKQFNLAIITEHNVSFVLPSAIILDERGSVGMITLSITNHSKKDQG